MRFYFYINKTTTNTVLVDYSLVDGTAISPGDFVAASGTVSIPANQTHAIIDVQIKGDPSNLRQPNLQFAILLSNPKFCTISTALAKGTIITEDGTYLPTDNTGYTTPLTYPGYSLGWSDEFSGTNLDLISKAEKVFFVPVNRWIAINQCLNGRLLACITVPLRKVVLVLHFLNWYCSMVFNRLMIFAPTFSANDSLCVSKFLKFDPTRRFIRK